ncbi:hypothetical protein HMPREF2565_09510 [Corynebacterium sp. HMSC072A04]|nr:hypothetical protein HMPREF2565_09510 [Corynebacterium sp. HMSC072A04]
MLSTASDTGATPSIFARRANWFRLTPIRRSWSFISSRRRSVSGGQTLLRQHALLLREDIESFPEHDGLLHPYDPCDLLDKSV